MWVSKFRGQIEFEVFVIGNDVISNFDHFFMPHLDLQKLKSETKKTKDRTASTLRGSTNWGAVDTCCILLFSC